MSVWHGREAAIFFLGFIEVPKDWRPYARRTEAWIEQEVDGHVAAVRWEGEMQERYECRLPRSERERLRGLIVEKFGGW